MKLSVITPILGEAKKLKRFLDAVLEQTLSRKEFEVIVVDDGSPPGLLEVFHDFQLRFTTGNCHLIQHQKNEGRAKARNSGIAVASGDVYLFLDVDNIPNPDSFQNIINNFQDGVSKAVRGNVRCAQNQTNSAYVYFFDQRYLGARGVSGGTLAYRYFATDAMAVSGNALKKTGTFDERFRAYGCEDEELGCRLKKHEIPLFFDPSSTFVDTDEPTLQRECSRLFEYAKTSLPLLLGKHPKYVSECLFPQLEDTPTRVAWLKKQVFLVVLNKTLATQLMHVLNVLDKKYRIPKIFFLYVIAAHYAAGYKARKFLKS